MKSNGRSIIFFFPKLTLNAPAVFSGRLGVDGKPDAPDLCLNVSRVDHAVHLWPTAWAARGLNIASEIIM